jgi:hypothetical protein
MKKPKKTERKSSPKVAKLAAQAKRNVEQEDKFLPLPLLMPVLQNLLQDAAFKDAINRGIDAIELFLNQFVIRVDKLEKRMDTMEHSLQIMVDARKMTGQWPADEKEVKRRATYGAAKCGNSDHDNDGCNCLAECYR